MVQAGLSSDSFPKVSILIGARKAALCAGSVPVPSLTASAGYWATWLRERSSITLSPSSASLLEWIYLPAQWPEPLDDELLPLSLFREMGPVAEGACVMLN